MDAQEPLLVSHSFTVVSEEADITVGQVCGGGGGECIIQRWGGECIIQQQGGPLEDRGDRKGHRGAGGTGRAMGGRGNRKGP